jgi:hypothetical protein
MVGVLALALLLGPVTEASAKRATKTVHKPHAAKVGK